MASLKTNFNLRNSKSESSKIHLVCRWANQKLVFPTDINIETKYWNNEEQRPLKKYSNYLETKTRLDNIENVAQNEFRKFINDSEGSYLPTVEEFREILNSKINGIAIKPKDNSLNFFEFVKEFINERKDSINPKTSKPFSIQQIKYYKVVLNKIEEYVKSKRIKNFNYENLNLEFHKEYTKYLRQKNYSTNYIGNHIKIIKLFLNESREKGYHNFTEHTKKKFAKPTEITDKIYLTVEELEQIENTDFSANKKLDNVRDLLLVGAWTGLRFNDFTNISKNDIFLNIPDGDYIEIQTSKTGRTVVIPILPQIRCIIDKYNGKTFNSLPKPISNQKFNEYVKEVGKISGIDTEISLSITKGGLLVSQTMPKYEAMSSHCCRRSFATNAYQMGVPTLTIREITGHNSESAFLRYIRATPKEHANKMREIMMKRFTHNLKIA